MLFVIRRDCPLPLLLVISLALVGCVWVPIPWKSTEPRIDEGQLMPLTVGVTTREDVKSALGTPDLTRRNNQLWIYGWSRGHGKLATIVGTYGGAVAIFDPLYYTHHVFFLEFNGAGTLIDMDLRSGDNACSKDGLCIQYWDKRSIGGDLFYEDVEKLSESATVVTASDAEDVRAKQFVADTNVCGVYLTGDDVWFSIGNIEEKPLHEGTYVFFELKPGKNVILFTYISPLRHRELRSEAFECRPGEIVYLDALAKWGVIFQRPLWTVSQERSVYPPKEIEGRRLQLLDGPLVNLPQDILIEKQYRQYLSRAPEDTTGLPYLCNAADGGHSNAQIEVGRHYAQG